MKEILERIFGMRDGDEQEGRSFHGSAHLVLRQMEVQADGHRKDLEACSHCIGSLPPDTICLSHVMKVHALAMAMRQIGLLQELVQMVEQMPPMDGDTMVFEASFLDPHDPNVIVMTRRVV